MLDTMEILAMLNKQAEIGSTYGTVDKRFVMRDVLERVYFVHAIDGLDGEVQWAIEKDITPEKLIAIFMQTATRAEAPVVAAALVRSVTENQDRQRVAEITVDSVSADVDTTAALFKAVLDTDAKAARAIFKAVLDTNEEAAAALLRAVMDTDIEAAGTLLAAAVDTDARTVAILDAVMDTDADAAGAILKAVFDANEGTAHAIFKAVAHTDEETAAAIFKAVAHTDEETAAALLKAVIGAVDTDKRVVHAIFKTVLDAAAEVDARISSRPSPPVS